MKFKYLIMLVLLSVLTTGCYLNDEVATNQVGVKLDENEIREVVGPGVYSEATCFFCDLKTMNIDTLTFSVEDPEVLTSDNQPVGVKITIQARRKSDDEAVRNIFTTWSALTDDTNLINTISATAREGMKNGTRGFDLAKLLNDRNGLAQAIEDALKDDVDKYSVEIINVTVENIAVSQAYADILAQTANLKAQTDQELRRQELIKQEADNRILEQQKRVEVAEAQILAEEAQTAVLVEIARREGEIIAASNQVYLDNPNAYDLRRLELLATVFGDKTMFIPSDTVLTLLQNVNGTLIPVSPINPAPTTGE